VLGVLTKTEELIAQKTDELPEVFDKKAELLSAGEQRNVILSVHCP
jgi:hypothetical protein